jgi:hypothetical protein
MIPASTNSSLNFPMAVNNSSGGISPASELFVALTRTITLIRLSPYLIALYLLAVVSTKP